MTAPAGYHEWRKQYEEHAAKAALHVRDCALCNREMYRGGCNEFKRLNRRMNEFVHDQNEMTPEWFSWPLEFLPKVLPASWYGEEQFAGMMYEIADRYRVIVSGAWEEDDRRWLHGSVSIYGMKTLPSWDVMREIKQVLFPESHAYMILPPKSQYINLREVLHMWCPVDGPVLPDFSAKGVSI